MTTETDRITINPSIAEEETELHQRIFKETRAWGFTLLVVGTLLAIISEVNSTWGLMLILVGLASFYFRSSAMLVIYAITLAWAGLNNIMTGLGGWIFFAIIQGYLAFQIFRRFLKFRPAEAELLGNVQGINRGSLTPARSAKLFPWAGFSLGIISLLGLTSIFVGVIIYVIVTESDTLPGIVDFAEGLFLDFAILGFATGLASLLSGYRWKILAILGLAAGALTLVIEIIFSLL